MSAAAFFVTTILVGGGLALLATAGGPSRPPHTTPIDVPGRDFDLEDVDTAVCLCWEAGQVQASALVLCTLERIYPDVPWPARGSDHESVRETFDVVTERVAMFLELVDAGENPCEQPAGPGLGEQPLDPIQVDDPFTSGSDVDALFAPQPTPGRFYSVPAGSSPVQVARAVFGFSAGDARVQGVLEAITRSGWNLHFYSRRQQGAAFGHVRVGPRWYDVGAAFLPRNARAHHRMRAQVMPLRTVSASGTKLVNATQQDSAFGALWIPPMEFVGGQVFPPMGDPFDLAMLPPLALLDWLGTSPGDLATRWGEALS
jgi:hypothetical protein